MNEKNSYTPINPEKYLCYGLKKPYKEFDNEKIPWSVQFFPIVTMAYSYATFARRVILILHQTNESQVDELEKTLVSFFM